MNSTKKADAMFSLVKQWKASGQTKQIFCNQHAITHHTLSYWVTKYNQSRQPSPGGFALIEAGDARQDQPLTLIYANGVQIRLSEINLPLISQLIRLG
jgi:transposase-like protein